MSLMQWAALVLAGALALGFAYITYYRREPRGRGRALLMALRATALILLVLLLIDPQFGVSARGNRNAARVILDASISMQPRAADSAAWRRALREAQQLGNGEIILAGAAPQLIARDSLAALTPQLGSSRMLPALQAAAEAGARRAVLVTDGAIEDAGDVARWLPRLGLQLEIKRVEAPAVANRAIAEVAAPSWAEAGKPVEVRVTVATRGALADAQAPIVIRRNGDEVARGNVVLAQDGLSSTTLRFNAEGPAAGGLVRYDVAFEATDSIPDDDVRSLYIFISEKPAGVAVVSFLPDWEPKFLHPVLAQALGLPVRTFLRIPNGSYVRAGGGLEAGTSANEAAVRAAIAQADVVVLHGVTENAPGWWRDMAARARRVIIFPAGALAEPFDIEEPVSGDWYISGDVPASPVAAFMQNVNVSELPPLEAIFAASVPAGAWAPLLAGRTRRGGRTPVLYAQQAGGRRIAIALATGYWRWAFRGGNARELYTRLWASLAGWMVQDQAQVAGAAIRPVRRTIERGEPLRWIAPGLVLDSMRVQIADTNGRVVQESTVRPQQGDTLVTAAVAPGHYRYTAHAYAQNEQIEASGPITIEAYSAEFIRPPANLSELRSTPQRLSSDGAAGGTPLHASAWPYVLLVLLLCSEWVLRRRWGLR